MNMLSFSLSLLSLWLSAVAAQQEVQLPFGGVDDATYNDWVVVTGTQYTRNIYLPGPDASNGAAIHWNIQDDRINLAVAVRATGWVGFGISENGGMRGADMVIFQADGEEIIDSHVLEELFPTPDACQSWSLVNSIVSDDGFLIFEASRLLNTGDAQDRALVDDSSLLVPANRIIAAWGDTSSYSHHGPNRARGSIRFFGVGNGDEWAAFATTMETEAEGSFEIRGNDFEIPAQQTKYKDFCFLKADLANMGVPIDESLHAIGIEPMVDERSAAFVHHFIVYGSYDPLSCGGLEVAFAWAPGDLPIALPLNLGGPLGAGGFVSYRIQVHYNNPGEIAGVLDSSGVKIFWTRQIREFDLGVLQLGDPILNLSGSSVGDGLTSHDFQCGSQCSSAFLSEPITVIREQLHMHASGRRMSNQQIRNDEVLRVGVADFFDYDQQGALNIVQDPYVVEPGDAFRTRCYYDSQDEEFGLASNDEMCIAFLFCEYIVSLMIWNFFLVRPY